MTVSTATAKNIAKNGKRYLTETVSNHPFELAELASLIGRNIGEDGMRATAIPRLFLIRKSQLSEPMLTMYDPALCIVVQGRKQVMLADEVYVYGPEQFLVISVDLPVVGQVIEATPAEPYICLKLNLDPGMLSALMVELGQSLTRNQRAEQLRLGLSISPLAPPLLDAVIRLARLLEAPNDIPVLAPLIEREILYRLLSGEYGDRLRQIAMADHRLVAVNRAINWLKRNYASPFRIETVAREARMSPSALHHSFKSVTAMSPLQYQKQLRLQEARRLMLGQAMDAATASHHVGYESPSQFSREYSRLFGAPPSRDIARLKESVGTVAAD
ncbi:MAG TPA: AraC family transcriptional regulator [Blastocatellia bacterium]|jgi:AraC-like DNA-binding protein|nr:AraC family transcriptional regulator [Blastocatellia bacterium]